jgi:hypothetical protein
LISDRLNAEFVPVLANNPFFGAKRGFFQESMASVRIPKEAFEKLGNPAADQAQGPFLNPVICRKGQV